MANDPNGAVAHDASLTSGFSNTGNAEADAVSNRSGGDYSKAEAGKETGTSEKQAGRTWHAARDDNEKDGSDRHRDNGGWV